MLAFESVFTKHAQSNFVCFASCVIFFAAFIYAVRKGQYDDSYTPSVRMLFEDELVKEHPKPTIKTKKTN